MKAKTRSSILIAEDDEAIRHTVVQYLEHSGFQVHAARDGQEALDLIMDMDSPCLALVVDLDMPRKSGDELIHELESKPERFSAYVLISGHPEDHPPIKTLRSLRTRTPLYYLPKPFDVSDLTTILKAVETSKKPGGQK